MLASTSTLGVQLRIVLKAVSVLYHWWPPVVLALIQSLRGDSIRAVARRLRARRKSDCAVVVGNGPSAAADLERVLARWPEADLFTVNQFPATDLFEKYRPAFVVFTDTNWWSGRLQVCEETLFALNEKAAWPVTVLSLAAGKEYLRKALPNAHVSVVSYTAASRIGMGPAMARVLYRMHVMMPVAVTVLLHAAFWPLILGYKRVILVGAEHGYVNLQVDQRTNEVSWTYDHFYGPLGRLPLDGSLAGEVFNWAECFRQWELLAGLARVRGVEFLNATAFSMIDSIDRYDR